MEPDNSLRVHKSPPLVPILNHMKSAHTSYAISLRFILISCHLRLYLTTGPFFHVSQPEFCMYFSFLPCMLHSLPILSSIWSS